MFRQARVLRGNAVQQMVDEMLPQWEELLTEEELEAVTSDMNLNR